MIKHILKDRFNHIDTFMVVICTHLITATDSWWWLLPLAILGMISDNIKDRFG